MLRKSLCALVFLGWVMWAGEAAGQARVAIGLQEGWRFKQGDESGEVSSAAFDDSGWAKVSLPHTWNRIGNEGVERSRESNNYRGEAWYRLRFPTPAAARGKRAFLQFDGVGAVADVWLNGHFVGRHAGAFSRFRFDVTSHLNPGETNLLVVKADNSTPHPGSPTEHVIPLTGDFFVFGGLYRDVSLIITAPVHIDMADFGGPGIYGRATQVTPEKASVSISGRVVNEGSAPRQIAVGMRIEDAAGHVVASVERRPTLVPGATETLESELDVARPRLWRGAADPYLYRIVVGVRSPEGEPLDEVIQPLGLRTMTFDADKGFFLNGERQLLRGASIHQDRPVKGWALSRADRVQDFDLLQEMGANAVRLAHYQHDQIAYELADARGLIVWAEIPLVSDVSFDGSPPNEALVANAQQQLNELIRQNFNHPSIAVWSIANEIDLRSTITGKPARAGELLRALNALAKHLDPGRLTTFADCCEQPEEAVGNAASKASPSRDRDVLAGLTDTLGYNRYFGWYYGALSDFGLFLDAAHLRHPRLPLAVSEYGAGAGLTQHSDNAQGGPVDPHGRPHPEEVQNLYHEESWRQIKARAYLWGALIWNMFDFASDARTEGDLSDVNDKGMVSYDRAVKKDVFYFYKANWTHTPTLHLVGRRYIDRAYGVVDVKAYSNATQARLALNGHDFGTTPCNHGVCIWRHVRLLPGVNQIAASAERTGTMLTDSMQWIFSGSPSIVRIKAGDVSGYATADGTRYGSDNFFIGGESRGINPPDTPASARIEVAGADSAPLYDSYRAGSFSYDLPMPDGTYTVVARFVEPSESAAGKRVFNVLVNGRVALSKVDPFALARGKLRAVDQSFSATATGGRLQIAFRPVRGDAVVCALEVIGDGAGAAAQRRTSTALPKL